MVHKMKMRTMIDNIITGITATPGASVVGVQKIGQFKRLELSIASLAVTMTDGTTNGSIGNKQLLTLASRRFAFCGAYVSLPLVAAANITATATVKASLGTAAEATNDTLDSVQADIMASTSKVLVSSAGTLIGMSTLVPTVDATSGTQGIFLNFGVADAGSSGNSTLTITGGVINLFFFELD